MKKTIQLFSAIAIFFTACNEQATNKDSTNTTANKDTIAATDTEIKTVPTTKVCYTLFAKDSASLSLTTNESNVTGELMYHINGKDSNKGTFAGTMKGDTLIGDYNFTSEGTQSSRPVAFVIKDNLAIEGYGATETKEGKIIFKNTSTLEFSKGIIMTKTDCK